MHLFFHVQATSSRSPYWSEANLGGQLAHRLQMSCSGIGMCRVGIVVKTQGTQGPWSNMCFLGSDGLDKHVMDIGSFDIWNMKFLDPELCEL